MSNGKANDVPYGSIVLFAAVVGLGFGGIVAGMLGGHDLVVCGLLFAASLLACVFAPELTLAQQALAATGWYPAGMTSDDNGNRTLGGMLLVVAVVWLTG